MKEELERALGRFFRTHFDTEPLGYIDYDALAEQIIVPVEVEHGHLEDPYKPQRDRDVTWIHGGDDMTWRLRYEGFISTPGPALAIILPLEEEDGED